MKTELFWVEECKFISDVVDNNGIHPKMNNNRDIFIRYCETMKSQAEKHKFFDAAEYISQCIDDLAGEA